MNTAAVIYKLHFLEIIVLNQFYFKMVCGYTINE